MPSSIVVREMIPEARTQPDYGAGVIAGIAGGLALTGLLALTSVFLLGLDLWAPPKMAVSLITGAAIARPGFDALPVLLGTLVLLGLSIVGGLLFAGLSAGLPMEPAIEGVLYGLVLYALSAVLLPSVAPRWTGPLPRPAVLMHAVAVLHHVAFGVVVGVCYRALRRLPPM